MSDQFLLPPYCDFHVAEEEEEASAVCLTHQKLMCHSCSLEKARSSESCIIRPLSKVADEKDKVLVEYLKMKQTIRKKRLMLKEGEEKTMVLKNDLKREINELYDDLNRHLFNLKDSCLKSVDAVTDDVTISINQENASLDAFENELEEYLEHNSDTTNEDKTESERKIMEKKSILMTKLCSLSADPKGHFQPNTELRDAILKSDKGIGVVRIEVHGDDIYDEVGQTGTDEQCMNKENKLQSIPNPRQDMQKITSSREPQNVSAPSEDNSPTLPVGSFHNIVYMESTLTKNDKYKDSKDGHVQSDGSSVPDGKKHRDSKHTKHHFRLPKLFSREEKPDATGKKRYIRKKSEKDVSEIHDSTAQKRPHATAVYEDVAFNTRKILEPKYLINKTVSITGLQTKQSHCWKFSKVSSLGNNHVVLLSKQNSTIVVAGLDGTVACQKQFKSEIVGVTVTACDQLAILLEKRTEVIKLDVAKNGLHKKGSFHVQEMILNITGFDFYEKESQYAVSSPRKLIVLDTDGLNIRTVSIDVSDYTEIVTTYDFEKNSLYILNIQHQTLKCFSYENSDAVWRRKFEGKELVPRSMFLYQGKLYTTFTDAIAVFEATDGNALDKHETSSLLKDCLGLCVMDDVVVFSSNSDEDEDSMKLAFIPL